jgi:two-component system, chemotaxis family, chemotaxis protein CheY
MDNSILVVCSEQYTLDVLNKELTNSGHNIQFEKDITRAAEFFDKGEKCNIALLCILPSNVKSILVLLELLKHKRRDLKCIMLSAMNDADIVSGCLMRGAAAVLSPPFTRKEIIATITYLTQGHSEEKDLIRILILEDDPVSGKLLINYLEHYGICDLVTDGKSAVEFFQKAIRAGDGYQLIFVDILVPEIQGHDVVRMIRETEQKEEIASEKRAKVIMTTSLSDAENIIDSFKADCDSYLIKPIRKAKLINEIKSLGLLKGSEDKI